MPIFSKNIPITYGILASLMLTVTLPAQTAPAKERPAAKNTEKPTRPPSKEQPLSVVRVNATTQTYDFIRPWIKRPPISRRAIGPVLEGGSVLVTAELVANATYVELEKPDTGDKIPASVEVVDYECNLALVKPNVSDFLNGNKPLTVTEANVGDELAFWQLEANGTLLSTRALFTTAEVSKYPIDDTSLLLYRVSSPLQPRDGSFTLPILKNGNLTGMLWRYDSRTQVADVIPAPVIAHFLKEYSSTSKSDGKTRYIGFPRAGLGFAGMRDPQLRRYAGLSNGAGGVYITQVQRGGAAETAGIQTGDVLLSIGGEEIDQDGNYKDARYGKVSVVHLISTRHFEGQEVPFKILRNGEEKTLNVKLVRPQASTQVIESYTIDKAPRYYVLGGLVFTELSRQFLREWGPDWSKKAPQRFVYFDRFQSELFRDDPRERIVILADVLPSASTVGYEDLSGIVVKEVNGMPLKSLSDIAAAVAAPVEGFHKIQFEGHPNQIVLDAAQVTQEEAKLKATYGLRSLQRLD